MRIIRMQPRRLRSASDTLAAPAYHPAMRVIAGRFRGALLQAPPGRTTRPITDQVKESLFNILGHRLGTLAYLPEFPVLDLFAGSGALGLESLSRGAASCVFVEHDRAAVKALRANIAKLRVGETARLAIENAWTLRLPPAAGAGYGLVFVDPPYRAAEDTRRALDLLERIAPRVAEGGIVVFRNSALSPPIPDQPMGLRPVDERLFGKMRVLLYERDRPAVSPDMPTPA